MTRNRQALASFGNEVGRASETAQLAREVMRAVDRRGPAVPLADRLERAALGLARRIAHRGTAPVRRVVRR